MRLHRLIGIIMLLDSRKIVKAKDIASILETSERTIYRDVDILCEAGIPVTSISGPAGGFSFMQGYKLNADSFNTRDIVNILISSMGVNAEKHTATYQELKNAIIKLENSVPEEYREEMANAKKKILYDSDPWLGEKVENSNIDIIKNAVFSLKKIKISYEKYNGERSERIIRPYGVVVKNSELYLSAFCEERMDVRIFKCSRIEILETLEEHFEMPEKFSLDQFWEKSKEQFFRRTTPPTISNKPYVVKMKFFQEKKDILQGFQVIHCENLGDCHIYYMNMISFRTACSVIFPLSDNIEIIEPKELKDYIVAKAKKIMSLNYAEE